MTDIVTIMSGSNSYNETKIFNFYLKQKLNQVGRFEFDMVNPNPTEEADFTKGTIVSIYINGTKRMDGYIEKIQIDEKSLIWHFDGVSLAGLLDLRATRTPVILRSGVNWQCLTATQLVQQALFRFGGFATTDWRIFTDYGCDGENMYLYKFEARSILDQIVTLAKISGYDWKVYLDFDVGGPFIPPYLTGEVQYKVAATNSKTQTIQYDISPDDWYDTNFVHRKKITMNSTWGSSATSYQLDFKVVRSTGVDSGYTTYVGDHCNSDYSDIRFTTAYGTPCDLWVEKGSTSASATVWVEFATIYTGNNTFYLYYGDTDASSWSTGTTTFPFFDDFDGSVLDTGKWSFVQGTPAVADSICTLQTTNPETIRGATTFGTGYSFCAFASVATSNYYTMMGWGYPSFYEFETFTTDYLGNNDYNAETYIDAVCGATTNIGHFATAYHFFEVHRPNTTQVKFDVDKSNKRTETGCVSTEVLRPLFHIESTSATLNADWVFVRKYWDSPPTITNWQPESIA